MAFPAGPSAGSGSAAHSPYVAAASGASAQQLLARGGVSLSAGTTPTAGGASPSAGSWGGLGIPLQPGGGSVGTMPPAPVPSGLGGLGPYPISAYLTNFPGSQLPAAPGSLPGEGDDSFVAVAPAAPAPAATHHHSHHRAAAAAPHGGSVLPVSTQQVRVRQPWVGVACKPAGESWQPRCAEKRGGRVAEACWRVAGGGPRGW